MSEGLQRRGFQVKCVVCGMVKSPVGRSMPDECAASYCDYDCEGYRQDPQPDYLFPTETLEEFGYGTEYSKAKIAALQAELAVARGLIYSMRNCFNCKYEDACVMGDVDRCGNGDGSTRLPDWEQALEGG